MSELFTTALAASTASTSIYFAYKFCGNLFKEKLDSSSTALNGIAAVTSYTLYHFWHYVAPVANRELSFTEASLVFLAGATSMVAVSTEAIREIKPETSSVEKSAWIASSVATIASVVSLIHHFSSY